MDNLEICYMSVVEMAEAIKTKRLSPVEVMDTVLSRIEQLNPKVNAYCTLLAESARKQARGAETMVMRGNELGPLHGIPVSIKDLNLPRAFGPLVAPRSMKTSYRSKMPSSSNG